ncbi:fucose-specific lectin FleA [Aspergillus novofumigatus IBT 16806]|uniref:Fucose-specific lectin n=1 Tax=Aspergillus novofumigatus (strain IBT 16806) TaxID=1392255 RepID=A0A2I1CJM5_ASPN1|nr:fucose-specific lectin [Aspergillus novofumigatus IBT 16806]PKX97806.1 fucose-specific lectin [Aspergillus novofumigatus IBT 16806]
MSTTGAQQVLFRTGIAAVNSTNRLRVYFQDVHGSIRESLYEGSWANGTEKNVIGKAKLGSPVAAASKELNNIRVYTLTEGNTLQEFAYDSGSGWYNGGLGGAKFQVAPYSRITAVFLAGTDALQLRIYAQKSDNTIQEYMWNGDGWKEGTNLGAALPGTGIGATSFRYTDHNGPSIRIWFQTDDLKLVQRAYDPHKSWYPNLHTIFDKAPPRTAIAATSYGAGNSSIYMRIYFVNSDNTIWQVCWDHGKGYNDKRTITPVIQGSEVAIISWGSLANNGPDLRLYFQNGTYVSAVSEWVWSRAHGSQLGKNALPA